MNILGFLLGGRLGLGVLAHLCHFFLSQTLYCVLPCLFLFFLGQLYRMVYHHFAVDRIAHLYLVFLKVVYGFSENLIIGKSVATAFLDLVDYIAFMRSFS